MRRFDDGWLERDGVQLHYVEWSSQGNNHLEPPVLLLHGLSSNARYWDRVAAALLERRVLALDQRGHGLTGRAPHSPLFPTGYAMEELVDDAAFVAAQLGLKRPVVVGHSWGASVALSVVATRPGFASALVFIDGPVRSPSHLFTWEEAQNVMQPPLPRYPNRSAAIADTRHDFGPAWAQDLEPFVDARIMPDGDHLVLTLTQQVRFELLKGLYDMQPEVMWATLDVPATALLARHNMARTSRFKRESAAALDQIAPQVAVKWFDTPHDIPLYLPGEIAREIESIATLAVGGISSEPAAR